MTHALIEHMTRVNLTHEGVMGGAVVPRFGISKKLEAQITMALGGLFLAFAFGGLMFLVGPLAVNEVRQKVKEARVDNLPVEERAEVRKAEQVTFGDYVAQELIPTDLNPADESFSVVIPKIGVNSKVIADVNANDADEYNEALKEGLAQARGSVDPGEKGDTFIFGHSTDYTWNIQRFNALFYNLKELEEGDKVYVYHEGEARAYTVTGKEVYEPTDVSFLDPNKDHERLVLQTCWPPGTVLKRLIVFAEPMSPSLSSVPSVPGG